MSRQWAIEAFDPVTASADAWAAYHAYRRIRREESSPDEPLTPDEVAEANMKRPDIHGISDRHVAWMDDAIVGFVDTWAPKPGTPEYESNKHLAWVHGGVITPARGQGIGAELLRLGGLFMRRDEQRVLNTYSHEPDGIRFLEHIGAECKQVERESRLYLRDVEWDRIERWRSGLAQRSPGTKIEIYTDPMPESLMAEYCAARTEMMNLMPWDDLEHGDIIITPEDMQDLYERLQISNAEHHTIFTREPDGRITSITDVVWRPHAARAIEQWFTGVHPDARGRGLGKAIKAEMVHFVNERYDDLEWVSTGNSTTNQAMLAINNRMGFKEHRRYNAYQIDRETVLENLAARGGG